MTIIYPINGSNTRMGSLFKTPKHLLLYMGVPAIVASIEYMQERFPEAEIVLLCNKRYIDELYSHLQGKATFVEVPDTDSQVETLRWYTEILRPGPVMFVDCDIVPLSLNEPKGNTVYLFENKKWMKQYSNYSIDYNNSIINCNEKGEHLPYAGAGVYFFQDVNEFNKHSVGCKSISEVIGNTLNRFTQGGYFKADTTSNIFRFGTLNDIKNDEQLTNRS